MFLICPRNVCFCPFYGVTPSRKAAPEANLTAFHRLDQVPGQAFGGMVDPGQAEGSHAVGLICERAGGATQWSQNTSPVNRR